MTSFQVAVDELTADAERFADASTTTKSIGDAVGTAPDLVDDWGWWEDAKAPIQSMLTAAKGQTDSGATELTTTSTTLAHVRDIYVQEENDNTHAATQIF